MSHVANQKKNTLLFTAAFLLVTLLLLLSQTTPSQAKVDPDNQTLSSAAHSDTVEILQSDESGISFNVFPPDIIRTQVQTENGTYEQIRIPGFDYTGVVGRPDLPQKGFLIALPPGAEPLLEVVSADSHTVPNVNVAPTVKQTLINDNYDDFTSPDYTPNFEASYPFDEAVYGQDALYPAAPVSLGQQTSLRHQRAVWITVNPVQVNPVQETLTVYSQLQISVTFAYPNGRPDVETLGPEEGDFAEILQNSLLNYEQSLTWRYEAAGEQPLLPETSPCMDANAFRINVKETGMYSVSHANLTAAYGSFPATVLSTKIRMCHNNQQIRIKVNDGGDGYFGSGDTVVFYGQSIKTQETDTNVYWLTYSTAGPDGIRMNNVSDSAAGTAPAYYNPNYHLENDSRYYSLIPSSDLNDHWYWQEPIVAEPNNPNVQDQLDIPFTMSNKASGVYDFTVRFELWGFVADELHEFEVKLNGTTIGTGQFSGSGIDDAFYLYEANAPASALVNGSNTLSIIALDTDSDPNNTGQRFLVNWAEIEPRRQFVAQNNRLAFGMETAGTYSFSAGSFTSGATVEIYDVTDPNNATYQVKTASGGSVAFNRTTAGPAEYELYATTAYLSPAAIFKDAISSGLLGTSSNTADMIIITTTALDSALTPLRSHRSSQGLTVKTVFVQDIFDEFSYGRYATYAIKEFLNYAYDNWSGSLDYVLLAGDGSYDHRNILGTNGNSNQVPVFLRSGIDPLLGEAAADNQYVDFNDDDLAEMMLGRLPAQTGSELTNMVNKILAYENSGSAIWKGRHLFVVDNAYVPSACNIDPAGDFFATVNNFINNHFPEDQILARLYYAPSACFPNNSGPYTTIYGYYATTLPSMQSRLIVEYNNGNQFISYTGHSGTQNWGHENFFNISSVPNLNNGSRTPVLLPMTCLEGWYHFSGATNGLSEAQIKRVGGGAMASYAPTGFQVQTGHNYLIEGFYDAIYVGNAQTLGAAVLAAKVNLDSAPSAFQDLHDTFMLLGDPAMEFQIPSISHTFLPVSLK